MCFMQSAPKPERPAPPPAPPPVLDQEAPEKAKRKKSKASNRAGGTKSLRTSAFTIGTGGSNGSTRSGGVNI